MPAPPDPPIFHITHINNLHGIMRAGCVLSDARIRQSLPVTNIGHMHIKDRRLARPVPVAARGMLGEYVPFNFCPRSVMLYVVNKGHQDYSGGQDEIVHLVSTVRTAIRTGRPWAFTDRHAELAHAGYYDDLAELGEVSWETMPLIYWSDPDIKEVRHAEFLVHGWFRWDAVLEIGVLNDQVASRVRSLIGSSPNPIVTVRNNWYY